MCNPIILSALGIGAGGAGYGLMMAEEAQKSFDERDRIFNEQMKPWRDREAAIKKSDTDRLNEASRDLAAAKTEGGSTDEEKRAYDAALATYNKNEQARLQAERKRRRDAEATAGPWRRRRYLLGHAPGKTDDPLPENPYDPES